MQQNQNKPLDFYRIKTEWLKECSTGALSKVKTEELVMASSYTDAEKVAYAIAEDQNRSQFSEFSIEIIKTKISEVLYNDTLVEDPNRLCGLVCNFFEESEDSGVGFYSVRYVTFYIDKKTGKEKKVTGNVFVPAASNSDATDRVKKFLNGGMLDFVVRDTKFDKAEALYWPEDVHEKELDNQN